MKKFSIITVALILSLLAIFLVVNGAGSGLRHTLFSTASITAVEVIPEATKSQSQGDITAAGEALLHSIRVNQRTGYLQDGLVDRVRKLTAILRDPAVRSEPELKAVASVRKEVLKELIPLNTSEALASQLTESQRRALPASVQPLLEQNIDAYGRLEALAVCGAKGGGMLRFLHLGERKLSVHLEGARGDIASQDALPVHGIAVDDIAAISELPYRFASDAGATQAGAAHQPVTVLVGDGQQTFPSLGDLYEWADRTRAAETLLPSPFKRRTVLFIRIDFSDAPGQLATDDEYLKSMVEVDRFYRGMSADQLYFASNSLPGSLRSAKTKAYYNTNSSSYKELMAEATALSKAYDLTQGGTGKFNPDLYDHVIVLFSTMSNYTSDVTPSGWAGQADILGRQIWLNGYWDSQTIAHEIGHNLGLSHGYAWKPTNNSPIGPGAHVEYGDTFDTMGSSAGKPLTNRQFSVPKKRALGFVTGANLISVQNSGQFRIYRHDGSVGSKLVGLRVAAGTAYDYWIEYRKVIPSDLSDYADAAAGGIQLRWNSLPSFTEAGATGTYLLDMTPGSAGDMKDAMLTLGQSFYDPTYRIRVTPLRTGSDADGDWIDVAVVLGDNPGNRAPALQSASSAEAAFSRVPVNLSARATDADGDVVLYQWDFGDGTRFYSTSGTVQKSWLQGGTYTVSVRAYDIYGGESRQSFQVSVSDPLSAWTRVAVPGFSDDLKAICYGGGRFVAVGGYAACWSSDGRQWTRSASGFSSMYAYSVAYGAGRFVAVGANWSSISRTFSTAVFSSADGVSWSTLSSSRSDWLNSVTYGAGKFVAVGDAGTIWSSPDGQNWSSISLTSKKNLKSICYDGSVFIAVGESGASIYSRDGTSWYDISITDANSDNGGLSWFKDTEGSAVVARDGGWYAMSSWSSNDKSVGISWSSNALGKWQAVQRTYFPFTSFSPSLALVAGGTSLITFPSISGGADVALSNDGKSWTSYSLSVLSTGPLHGAVEANGRIVAVGDKGQIYISSDGTPAVARQPQGQTVTTGARISLSVTAYATGPFTYQWRRNGIAIVGATSDTFTIGASATSDSGDYTVSISNSRGTVVSAVATVVVQPANTAPVIVAGPSSQTLFQGANTQLTVTASGTPAPTYQWLKDGVAITGATSSALNLAANGSSSGGLYSVVVTNSSGSVTSRAAILQVLPTSRLSNLSVRSSLQSGQTMIVGAVVVGGSKGLLLRAAGPALNQFGLPGMPDPLLELYAGGSQPIATNNDWSSTLSPLFQSVGAFGFTVGSKDAAMNPTMSGAFTAQVKGVGSGSVLVEAYDVSSEMSPRLINLSARHMVGTGADVLIAGFYIAGSGTKQVLIRAVGPTLAAFGVPGTLVDPQFEVLDSSGRVLGSNDNWAAQLSATFTQVGAFALQSGSRDAAMLISLPAGASYTVKVSGVNGVTGEALVEIYEVF